MHYTYTALSQAGTKVNGDIEAESPEEAMDKLANQGLLPRKVKPKSQASLENLSQSLNLMLTRVKAPDLVIFSKQFRTLFHAGIPLTSLLQILEQQTENPRLKKAATDMNQDVQAGKSLTEAFQAHPGIFSQLYCSMIQAGESSGRMTEVLDRLIYLLQHEYKVKSDVKTALRYPILVLVVLFGAFIFLLTFVIPRFIRIFEGAGLELPLPTRISVALYEGLVVYWPVSLAGLAALVLGLYLFLRTETGQYYKDYFLLRIPILGPVFQKAAMSRFSAIFSILQASGLSVLNAMEILTNTIGNKVISSDFARIQQQLREGRGISQPLSQAKFFTPMVISMVAVGEESGNLDQMLSDVSTHYDDEVEYAVSRLSESIGPILIVALAAMVGFFALSIFLPMWDMVQTI